MLLYVNIVGWSHLAYVCIALNASARRGREGMSSCSTNFFPWPQAFHMWMVLTFSTLSFHTSFQAVLGLNILICGCSQLRVTRLRGLCLRTLSKHIRLVIRAGMPSIPSDDSIDSKLAGTDDGRCNSFQGTLNPSTQQVAVLCIAQEANLEREKLMRANFPCFFLTCKDELKISVILVTF